MPNIKDFTGAVNINADITPVTRQKIEKVSPEKWGQMNITQLWDQRIILNNRSIKAFQCGHAEIAKQLQIGLNTLDMLLQRLAAEAEAEAEAKAVKNPALLR